MNLCEKTATSTNIHALSCFPKKRFFCATGKNYFLVNKLAVLSRITHLASVSSLCALCVLCGKISPPLFVLLVLFRGKSPLHFESDRILFTIKISLASAVVVVVAQLPATLPHTLGQSLSYPPKCLNNTRRLTGENRKKTRPERQTKLGFESTARVCEFYHALCEIDLLCFSAYAVKA